MQSHQPTRQEFEIICKTDFLASLPQATAVNALAQHTQLSKQKIKRAMQHGAVWLKRGKTSKRIRRASKILESGDILQLFYDEHLLSMTLEAPQCLYDLKHYSVWYKPYGVLSQGSKWGDYHTLNRFAEINLKPQRPAFIVHRLDRAASGLMLLAHSKTMAGQLSRLFSERTVDKAYLALTEGHFPTETIKLHSNIDGKDASSTFNLIHYDETENVSLVKAEIETGRKHQIRIHLKDAGFPIIGDRLYGGAKNTDKNLQLCSVYLGFECPISKTYQQYFLPDSLLPESMSKLKTHASNESPHYTS